VFSVDDFPGRRFASMEEVNRAIEDRDKRVEFLRKLRETLSYKIYKFTKIGEQRVKKKKEAEAVAPAKKEKEKVEAEE